MAGWTTPKTMGAEVGTSTDWNTHVRDNLMHLKENIGLAAPAELTISGGVVTKTKSFHTIDTQSDDPSDDLNTINGGSDGDVIFLSAEHTDRTVVLKNETGNMHIGGDMYLDNTHHVIGLIYSATDSEWHRFTGAGVGKTFMVNDFRCPNPGTDWSFDVKGVTLAQNKATKLTYLPLNFLKIDDLIVSYKLVGDATEGTALTLDCKLVRVNKADPVTTSDITGGGIAQVNSNGNFDVLATLTAPELIATDKQYILQVTATTTGSDSFVLMGAEVLVIRE